VIDVPIARALAFRDLKLVLCALSVFAGCQRPQHPAIEALGAQEGLSAFKLGSLRGTRDGDRLDTQAMFTDSSSILTLEMRFLIGSPTTLVSGTWRWPRGSRLMSGAVAARSVTFLGGQDGPPSIGGRFDLLGPEGAAQYRVTIPVTQLKERLKIDPSWSQPNAKP